MWNTESDPRSNEESSRPSHCDPSLGSKVNRLTERQRVYLRLVFQRKSSKEIAAATESSSYRAVDKQLLKANAMLGVATRFEAAQLLADHEQGVERLHPANALPSVAPLPLLPPLWPTTGAAANTLSLRQAASWTAIIAIVTPIGLTAAGMAFLTLLLLLRLRPF